MSPPQPKHAPAAVFGRLVHPRPIPHAQPSGHSPALVVLVLLVVAACLVAAWLRTGYDEQPKTTRGRLREFGWCVALVVIAARTMSLFPSLENRDFTRTAVLPLAAYTAS
jgi:hypothetical protein